MSAEHGHEAGHGDHVEADVKVKDAHGEVKAHAHVDAKEDAVDDIFNGISKITRGVRKGIAGILGPLWNGLKKVGSYLEKKLGLSSKKAANGHKEAHPAHGHDDGHGHAANDNHGHGDDHGADHGHAANDNHGHGDDHGKAANDNHGHGDDHGADHGHGEKKAAGGHH